jgi:hypothetical protein
MTLADFTNGAFEAGAGAAQLVNCHALYRDKVVRGVNWKVTLFFIAWGFWNLYYYPSLDQVASLIGGLLIVSANVLWVLMYLHYRNRDRVPPQHVST